MIKLDMTAFYATAVMLKNIEVILKALKKDGKLKSDSTISEDNREKLLEQVVRLHTSLSALGAKVTLMAVDRLVGRLKSTGVKAEALIEAAAEIDSRLRDELNLSIVLALENEDTKYFEPTEPLFGVDFETKFPSGIYELEEAAKCLALSRTTAAVFHLMRLMEVGLHSVGQCLQIPPPTSGGDRNWGNVLGKIKNELNRRNGAGLSGWPIANDKRFFEEAYASLDAVRVAWRNTTMHVENKYTKEEAEHIVGAVRGFMKKIASRHDENGLPTG